MGQGSDSCGGYEVDYDPYDELMENGEWTTRGGGTIKITDMTIGHLRGARRIASRAAHEAQFSSDEEKWEHWVQMFDSEIALRERNTSPSVPKAPKAPPKPVRGTNVIMICHCKREYPAREADLKRGNALSCSKSCAAIRREFGREPAQRKPQ